MALNKDIYGVGWKFPFKKTFKTSDGADHVKECLYQLIAVGKGERLGRINYGCGITKRVFDNFDDVVAFGPSDIADAIDTWEPRVVLLDVRAVPDEANGVVTFYVIYRLIKDNVVDNLVLVVNENGTIQRL